MNNTSTTLPLTSPQYLAEWEKQSTVLLAWPHQGTDWVDNLQAAQKTYCEIIKTICQFQPVTLLCPNSAIEHEITELLKSTGPLEWNKSHLHIIHVNYNDTWIRDYGPISLLSPISQEDDFKNQNNSGPSRSTSLQLVDFTFNGWGQKFSAELDNQVTTALDESDLWYKLTDGNYSLVSTSLVLEGGSIDSDGAGSLLTTRHCLLADHRNQPMSYQQIESDLKLMLCVDRILTLNHGQLEGDDTDGHIDTLARFCSTSTIVFQGCQREDDSHFPSLQAMEKELRSLQQSSGEPYQCIALPLPEPKFNRANERLPASYANFLIINGAVLVPTYQDPHDEEALNIIQSCFPNREVIGVDCMALIEQGGSLHCCTMQVGGV